jgi:hypothetical protein
MGDLYAGNVGMLGSSEETAGGERWRKSTRTRQEMKSRREEGNEGIPGAQPRSSRLTVSTGKVIPVR